jgi:hypothetical protein
MKSQLFTLAQDLATSINFQALNKLQNFMENSLHNLKFTHTNLCT